MAPALSGAILFPLLSHPDLPRAVAYASLDYGSIGQFVLDMEAAQNLKADAANRMETEVRTEATRRAESFSFELASEKERVEFVIFSVRKRFTEFCARTENVDSLESVRDIEQEDARKVWSTDVYLPELLCLLPIAVSQCPLLLFPECMIFGLLTTRWGFLLLCAILINNPSIVVEVLSLLSQFLSSHQETFGLYLNTQSELPPVNFQLHTGTGVSSLSQERVNTTIIFCVKQALLTMMQLSRVSCSMAFLCRDALVKSCAFPGLVLYVTSQFLHDELDFLSKVLFSLQKTSEWMLYYFRAGRKDPLDALVPLYEEIILMSESHLMRAEKGLQAAARDELAAIRIRRSLLIDAQTTREQSGWCGQLHGHLKLFCALICAADFHPLQEEADFWLTSLSGEFAKYHPIGFPSQQTLLLGISFFCLVPGLSSISTRNLFHKSLSALLKSKVLGASRCCAETETAVWFTVQLLLQQYSNIIMVVREVLGMHVNFRSSLLKDLRDASLTAEVIFNPTSITKAVASLRPRGPISTKTKQGYFTLTCLEQMLSSGHFLRYGVDVSEAVSHCIAVSSEPIHPLLVQVIQACAESPVLTHGIKSGSHLPLQLPHSFLEEPFLSFPLCMEKIELIGMNLSMSMVVKAVLNSYYILCKERVLRSLAAKIGCESSETSIFTAGDEVEWWSCLLAKIPFQQLVCYMERNWLQFEHIFSQWLSLAAVLFPEWLHTPALLDDEIESLIMADEPADVVSSSANDEVGGAHAKSEHTMTKDKSASCLENNGVNSVDASEKAVGLTVDLVRTAMQKALEDPVAAEEILHFLILKSATLDEQIKCDVTGIQLAIMEDLVPRLLDFQCPRFLQQKFCLWWKSRQTFTKQLLLPAFIDSIFEKSQDSHDNGVVTLQIKKLASQLDWGCVGKYKSLVQQPFLLLACKLEIYRTPLLSILLDTLSGFLTVNNRLCLSIASAEAREDSLSTDEVTTALMAQDSAVCQILLEACIKITVECDNVTAGTLVESRKLISGFLASFLDSKPMLLKLLHFQGYNLQLVPMMVEEVPAMVQCLAFTSDLLRQQDHFKKVFSISLIANTASAYAEISESLIAVRQVIAHVPFVWQTVCSSSEYLLVVIEAISKCICAFPAVVTELVSILQSCTQSACLLGPSGEPGDSALQKAALDAFEHLIQQHGRIG